MSSVLVLRRHTYGDFIFTQKILWILLKYDYKVYWPLDGIQDMAQYISHPNLTFDSGNCDYTIDLENSIEEDWPRDVLTCKYKMPKRANPNFEKEILDLTHENWGEYINFNRNRDKENRLKDIVGAYGKYHLVNKNFSRKHSGSFNEQSDLNVIEMRNVSGYSLVDWSTIIEEAEEISSIDTALQYLTESLDLKAKVLRIYPRHKDAHLGLAHLFKKDWNWQNV